MNPRYERFGITPVGEQGTQPSFGTGTADTVPARPEKVTSLNRERPIPPSGRKVYALPTGSDGEVHASVTPTPSVQSEDPTSETMQQENPPDAGLSNVGKDGSNSDDVQEPAEKDDTSTGNEEPFGLKPKEQRSREIWKQCLEQGVGKFTFKEDHEIEADLIGGFNEGVDYVYDTYGQREKGRDLIRPETVIATRESIGAPFAADSGTERNYVYIAGPWIEKLAGPRFPPTDHITIERDDGDITFVGTPRDFFRLGGVEEGHHRVFAQAQIPHERNFEPSDSDQAHYDAQDDEYHALRWQKRFAEEKGMPEETLDVLNQRLNAAKDVRRQTRKTT